MVPRCFIRPCSVYTYFNVSLSDSSFSTLYYIPIGDEYVLRFEFLTDPLRCEFFSPEHNLPEATEQCIQDFMQAVTVELSLRALAEKQTVESALTLTHSKENKPC
ncbi:hypothetical protein [Aliikangiella sp. IMCC44359]|uniref:hypothetical protein n=1 Tax=Aliikangiella sp. IMCC44359 TaxID=3459125 RepID=UPI00403AE085